MISRNKEIFCHLGETMPGSPLLHSRSCFHPWAKDVGSCFPRGTQLPMLSRCGSKAFRPSGWNFGN
ncbi:hypothetical protein HMPREF1545_02497 [Oscillibacter sp. KLE 1728]|nr:hypothetical protein HMPREF1545_02497 [Oscillibacter sp. KLE 1728]